MELLKIPTTSPDGPGIDHDSDVVIRKRRRIPKPGMLFLLVVVLPVLLSVLYFGFIASDVYISESQFVVRSPQKPATSPLGQILQTAGFANATDEADAAQSYAVSRDALRTLNQNHAFERAYTRPGVSFVDRFDPLGIRGSFEYLFNYFQGKVTLSQDSATSIFTLTVRAFTPQDAFRFNQQLLQMTEATVNKLNQRGRQDLVQYAQTEVDIAKAKSQAAALALAAYRNRSGVVDPQAEAQAKLQMVYSLQTQLIAGKTELAQVQRYAPQNPRIPVLRTEIAAMQQEINNELSEVRGSPRSLAGNSVRYERLSLESDFADKQLAAALASLEEAKDDARRKQAYVERIVEPNLPDSPMEPERLRGIFATLVLSLVAFGILRMLSAGLREHAQ